MDYKNAIRNVLTAAAILGAIAVASVMTVAQDKATARKPVAAERKSGRDPFKKYEPVAKTARLHRSWRRPPIQVRIDRYRRSGKMAARARTSRRQSRRPLCC